MKIKYAVVYNYERTGNLKNDGTASISVRAYLNGKHKFFTTGIYIQPNQWSGKNANWVKNHSTQFHLNKSIRDMLDKMLSFEHDVLFKENDISLERLGDYKLVTSTISFTDLCNEQLEYSKSSIQKSSYTDQRQTINKLKEYQKVIYLSQLSFRMISGFDKFLLDKGLGINTVAKHHKNLKKFIHLAIKLDYFSADKNPYKKFKVKREVTERVFLMDSELALFEKLEFKPSEGNPELVRDMFLFMSYTGLRFSDASNLTAHNFNDSPEGLILTCTAQKTKKPHRLNLKKLFAGKPERLIKEYLEKYDVFYFDDPDTPRPIFLGIANQTVNRKLKEIVKCLNLRHGVKEKLSCHSARHTFGTIMARKVKLPVLQKLMQHSKLKETQIYLHLSHSMVDDALDDVKW